MIMNYLVGFMFAKHVFPTDSSCPLGCGQLEFLLKQIRLFKKQLGYQLW